MSNNVDQADVVVAGGGPVGCTLSIALSNLGVDNIVVERSTEPHPLPRAILIDGELVRALVQNGLGEDLLPLLTPMRTAEYVDVTGHRLSGEDLAGVLVHGGLAPASVHYQPDLDALLEREVVARGARFLRGRAFTGVRTSGDGADLVLDDGSVVRGRHLVGCDGASSTVRRSLGIGWEDLGFDQDWLVVDIEVHDRATCGLPDVARQICDPSRPTTMISGHDRYYRWELQLQPGEDPNRMNRPDDVWRLLSPWIDRSAARLVRSAAYRFHAVVATTMRQGPVLLAGDAAHQMPPFMGQGLNSGMRDAVNLAWKLAWIGRGWSHDSLLDTYTAERRPHAKAVIEASVDAGRLIDQYAGRESHGITPREGYGGSRPANRYHDGVVVPGGRGVGAPFHSWDRVGGTVPTGAEMTLVSSVDTEVALPSTQRWRRVRLEREALLGADHIVVRPDGWVAASCDDASVAQVLADLEDRLAVVRAAG